MLRVEVLTGSRAGHVEDFDEPRFSIGRARDDSLRLDDAGVWDQHVVVERGKDGRFHLQPHKEAVMRLDGAILHETSRMPNGRRTWEMRMKAEAVTVLWG